MCCSSAHLTKLALLLTSLAGVQAAAQNSASAPLPAPSTGRDSIPVLITLSLLRDEDAYEHSLASLTAGVAPATWLSASIGASRAPSDETDVSADLVELGIEHDFGPVGINLSHRDWGDANNLESGAWRAQLFVDSEKFRFALVHERRDIDIFFSAGGNAPLATDLRRIGIDADGTGIDWRYRFTPQWQVYGSWMDYDYPLATRLVPRADRLGLLSTSAVTLAYGFVESYTTLGVERELMGSRLLNFDLARDRSTIDGSTLFSASVSLLLPVAQRMDLELTLGSSDSSRLGSTLYGGLALLFYRGG